MHDAGSNPLSRTVKQVLRAGTNGEIPPTRHRQPEDPKNIENAIAALPQPPLLEHLEGFVHELGQNALGVLLVVPRVAGGECSLT